jgi:hypothetical protein
MAGWRTAGAAALIGLGLGACATSRTQVIAPAPAERAAVHSVRLVAGAQDAGAPLDDIDRFEKRLRQRLFRDGAFSEGAADANLTIEYSIQRYDEGAQVHGYVTGVGKDAAFTVLVRFLAPDGRELSKIMLDEKVEFGRAGASARKAANQAADYAIAQFR